MILVTGSTGTFGSSVLKLLKQKGIQAKGVSQSTQPLLIWNKPETFHESLSEIDKVFIVSPPNYKAFPYELEVFLKKVKENGIKFILLSTVYGVNNAPESALFKAEEIIKQVGIDYSIVRPNFIFQNFINFDIEAVKSGKIYLPTDVSKTSYIDVRDVAKACVTILQNPKEHTGKTYTLSGKESLSHDEMADIFTEILNRKVENIKPSNEEYKQALINYGLPNDIVDFMCYLYAGINAGYFSETTDDFKNITSNEPITFKTFVEEHKNIFA